MGSGLRKGPDGKPFPTHPTTAKFFPPKTIMPLPSPKEKPAPVVKKPRPTRAPPYNPDVICGECEVVGHQKEFCFLANPDQRKSYTDLFPATKSYWDNKARLHQIKKDKLNQVATT